MGRRRLGGYGNARFVLRQYMRHFVAWEPVLLLRLWAAFSSLPEPLGQAKPRVAEV